MKLLTKNTRNKAPRAKRVGIRLTKIAFGPVFLAKRVGSSVAEASRELRDGIREAREELKR